MNRVLILVEGQTEETFVREVLARHLEQRYLALIPTITKTRRVKSGPDFKGGVTKFRQIERDLVRLFEDGNAVAVTTMFDYYSLPDDFPGKKSLPAGSCFDRVAQLEHEFSRIINRRRFIPYLSLHEFEALLFSAPDGLAACFPDVHLTDALFSIVNRFESPEEIDEGKTTHPSARIRSLLPSYRKIADGVKAATEIGLERIRSECPHFHQWLTRLEDL